MILLCLSTIMLTSIYDDVILNLRALMFVLSIRFTLKCSEYSECSYVQSRISNNLFGTMAKAKM